MEGEVAESGDGAQPKLGVGGGHRAPLLLLWIYSTTSGRILIPSRVRPPHGTHSCSGFTRHLYVQVSSHVNLHVAVERETHESGEPGKNDGRDLIAELSGPARD